MFYSKQTIELIPINLNIWHLLKRTAPLDWDIIELSIYLQYVSVVKRSMVSCFNLELFFPMLLLLRLP